MKGLEEADRARFWLTDGFCYLHLSLASRILGTLLGSDLMKLLQPPEAFCRLKKCRILMERIGNLITRMMTSALEICCL